MKHMFWADNVAKKIAKRNLPFEWVDDMKTPSGRIHVGSLFGVVFHDLVYRALCDQGVNAKYTYVFENHDPMDDIPSYLPREKYEQYLGTPLFKIPSPVEGYKDFAEYYALEFKNVFNTIGTYPEIVWTKDLYTSGKMNDGIKNCLDNAEKIRDIYREMYEHDVTSDWYPFQVYCEQCGKVSTTKVYNWDGKDVWYRCHPNGSKLTNGCGYEGKTSPFSDENGMKGKMPWKVEWAVKWQAIGITVEGAGKDHMSKGGSHDFATKVCERVLHYPVPFPISYEFMLVGGKKMSSSKGRGFSASDMLEILSPELVRFLIVKMDIKKQTNFDPSEKHTIPKLFDDYQQAAEAYYTKSDKELSRVFELSQINKPQKPPAVRFSVLAQWVQMPNMQEKIEKEGLEEWAKYARVWVERFAPESEKFLVQETLPDAARELTDTQKKLLGIIASELDSAHDAESFQTRIYDNGKELGLSGKETFAAIYKVLIGKDHGPKAAWLILSLDKDFVKNRFLEVSAIEDVKVEDIVQKIQTITKFNNTEIFSISKKLKEEYPSISIGIAVIKGVSIKKTDPELEKEKQQVLNSLQGLTTEELGKYPEVTDYRKLYKAMGIDWHSRRPSPEALLRRVVLNKGLYTINTCVDAYNLIVMKHRISVGAFDLDTIEFPTVLRLAKNGEEILLLGDSEPTKYRDSEIAYFDKNGGYNIDFNFRDAQRTAVKESTKNLYINVDGVYGITPEKVELSLRQSCDMIMKCCGGTLESFGIVTNDI